MCSVFLSQGGAVLTALSHYPHVSVWYAPHLTDGNGGWENGLWKSGGAGPRSQAHENQPVQFTAPFWSSNLCACQGVGGDRQGLVC